jgi:hypothetical protein
MKPDSPPSRDEILEQALALDPGDRAFLVDELERSLPPTTFASEEIGAAWSEEIDRRIADYQNGRTNSLDINSALGHVRQALSQHRSRRLTP